MLDIRIQPASLHWDADGHPRSLAFDDIYYEGNDGLAASRYVFMQSNQILPRLFLGNLVIGEIGFGTGLNFLALWQAWEHAGAPNGLHFISLEKFPLQHADAARVLGTWPELAEYAEAWLAVYPSLRAGWHTREFAQGRVRLVLWLGDAKDGLHAWAGAQPPASAWFLDGFAPARNPALWDHELCALIAANSRIGATFSTFTAAGQARRNLQQAGFIVRKQPGFGRKRDMLVGEYSPAQTIA